MDENESSDDMITRFTEITISLSSLSDTIDNDQKVRRVIRALPPSWEVKYTTLKELSDKEEMNFMGLIGNMKTHEMKKKVREEKALTKKKLAFKITPTISNDDKENEQEDDKNSLCEEREENVTQKREIQQYKRKMIRKR